jgi:hypothetical protein
MNNGRGVEFVYKLNSFRNEFAPRRGSSAGRATVGPGPRPLSRPYRRFFLSNPSSESAMFCGVSPASVSRSSGGPDSK